ncbi:MAG: LysR family transcriptional regulator [Negativicutes bacterium]|nr:LysR family transcriptional regulator [Negativicutes bacterium]
MDTFGIKAFLAVVRHGSLTEAANSLFLSQSTLSNRLAELERELGMTLIDRGRGLRSLVLTDCGKEFLLVAKRWEDLLQDTKRIQSRTNDLTLAIGAVDTIHTFVLPPLYQSLRDNAEKLKLRVRTHNSTELYFQVDRGELDVAFPLQDLPMRNIVVQKFYAEPRVVVRRELSPGECNKQIDPASLDPALEIFFEADPVFQRWYERWLGGRDYPVMQVDTAQLLLPLLNQLGAWSIVPFCMAQKFAASGTFSYYRLEDPPPERICYKIHTKNPRTSVGKSLAILDTHLKTVFNTVSTS